MKNLKAPRSAPIPNFTPVPRRHRYDGWTAERQRAFIDALAELGSVKHAAHSINMSAEGAYYLRRQPGADSFREAWDAALDFGVTHLADIAMARAIDGVPVPIMYQGEQVAERRTYNDRLMMFILRHHLPERYGELRGLRPGTKHPDTLRHEGERRRRRGLPALPAPSSSGSGNENGEDDSPGELPKFVQELIGTYEVKLAEERRCRLAGAVVEADFTLRQLTFLEVLLDLGGGIIPLLELAEGHGARFNRPPGEPGRLHASEVSRELAEYRRDFWAAHGEPRRPDIHLEPMGGSIHSWGGPNWRERDEAQAESQRIMARGQAMWEAAANEDTWAVWKAENGR